MFGLSGFSPHTRLSLHTQLCHRQARVNPLGVRAVGHVDVNKCRWSSSFCSANMGIENVYRVWAEVHLKSNFTVDCYNGGPCALDRPRVEAQTWSKWDSIIASTQMRFENSKQSALSHSCFAPCFQSSRSLQYMLHNFTSDRVHHEQ